MIRYSSLASLFLLTTAIVASSAQGLTTGCASLQFAAAPQCFMADTELFPGIATATVKDVKSASECQTKCASKLSCAYFTFISEGAATECVLKPAPSLAASLKVTIRKVDAASEKKFTSGPKTCDQKCEEPTEAIASCDFSSPGACGLMAGTVRFNFKCVEGDEKCDVNGYKCCRDCSASGSCCDDRLKGAYLSGGEDLGSVWNGVATEDECYTKCATTKGCTHWNFVKNRALVALGNACYLKTYSPVDKPVIKKAAKDSAVAAVVGSVDCNKSYGIRFPVDDDGDDVPDIPVEGTPIEGTCFESGVDIKTGILHEHWNSADAEACQKSCQAFVGCKWFVYDVNQNKCSFTFNQRGKVRADPNSQVIVGPKYCPDDPNKGNDKLCYWPGLDIVGGDMPNYPAADAWTLKICQDSCTDRAGCEFFTYEVESKKCFFKSSKPEEAKNAKTISGPKRTEDCTISGASRRLDSSDSTARDSVLAKILAASLPAGCVLENKDYYGGDLEGISNVESIEECRKICLDRDDCRLLSYVPMEKVCYIKYAGHLVEKVGVFAMPRICPTICDGDVCPNTDDSAIFPAVSGLSVHNMGSPTNFIIKGAFPDFKHPRAWERVSILVLTNDGREDCFVSDLMNVDKDCWERRLEFLPLRVRVQVFAVAENASFNGWRGQSWEKTKKSYDGETEFEFFNEEIEIVEHGKPNSDHGIFMLPIAQANVNAWPADMESPVNFKNGSFHARFQVLSVPTIISSRLMMCITASETPVSEICSRAVVAPPNSA